MKVAQIGRVDGKHYCSPPPIRNRACDFHRTRLLKCVSIVTIGLLTWKTYHHRNVVW